MQEGTPHRVSARKRPSTALKPEDSLLSRPRSAPPVGGLTDVGPGRRYAAVAANRARNLPRTRSTFPAGKVFVAFSKTYRTIG